MKPACRKNTFHINLLGPLVETFALMNHDLSEAGGGRGGVGLCSTDRPARSHLAGYLVCHWEAASGFSLDNRPLFPASVLLRGLPGQMESVMHCSCSGRAEQRVHGCQGYGRTRDIFHPSRERRKGAERTDKQRTEEQSSRFFRAKLLLLFAVKVFRLQAGFFISSPPPPSTLFAQFSRRWCSPHSPCDRFTQLINDENTLFKCAARTTRPGPLR